LILEQITKIIDKGKSGVSGTGLLLALLSPTFASSALRSLLQRDCLQTLLEHAMQEKVHFTLNSKPTALVVDSDRMLLWVLRTDLGLTGTKYGCGQSQCGACTVVVNGEAVRSCVTPLKEISGKEVLTIEGLSAGDKLHPLQKAFMEHDALQCGYCTPGMIMNAYSFLRKNPRPTTTDIIRGMDENLCRCGAHTRIIRAIQKAAGEIAGGR
jgi:aerobic-type carbon monoxide dehydrogenase small subunit (CoxS/CutS family)